MQKLCGSAVVNWLKWPLLFRFKFCCMFSLPSACSSKLTSTYFKRLEREEFWIGKLKTVYHTTWMTTVMSGTSPSKQRAYSLEVFITSISKLESENQNDPIVKKSTNPRDWLTNLVITNQCVATFGLRNTFFRYTRTLIEKQLHLLCLSYLSPDFERFDQI